MNQEVMEQDLSKRPVVVIDKRLHKGDSRIVMIGGTPTAYPAAKIAKKTIHLTRKIKLI